MDDFMRVIQVFFFFGAGGGATAVSGSSSISVVSSVVTRVGGGMALLRRRRPEVDAVTATKPTSKRVSRAVTFMVLICLSRSLKKSVGRVGWSEVEISTKEKE